jgi:hypothetical protein
MGRIVIETSVVRHTVETMRAREVAHSWQLAEDDEEDEDGLLAGHGGQADDDGRGTRSG